MPEYGTLALGIVLGVVVAFMVYALYQLARGEVERYVNTQVREAKKELREWVRAREDGR